jgi:tRNA (guanine37-N1)-methyltransferase
LCSLRDGRIDPRAREPTGSYRSYDVIGDIVVTKIPERSKGREGEIGCALLDANPKARLVLQVVGRTEPTTRVRAFRRIAGAGPTTTIHREHGASYFVDLSKVFFSPRLSHERRRICRMVEDGERILNCFSGVGSFSLLIAKWRDADVHSLDISPFAIACIERGIGENELLGTVFPVLGDARRPPFPTRSFDRVLLPLPALSDAVLGPISRILHIGGTLHTYREARGRRGNCRSRSLGQLEALLNGLGLGNAFEILASRVIRPVGPKHWHVVHDLKLLQPPGPRKEI